MQRLPEFNRASHALKAYAVANTDEKQPFFNCYQILDPLLPQIARAALQGDERRKAEIPGTDYDTPGPATPVAAADGFAATPETNLIVVLGGLSYAELAALRKIPGNNEVLCADLADGLSLFEAILN